MICCLHKIPAGFKPKSSQSAWAGNPRQDSPSLPYPEKHIIRPKFVGMRYLSTTAVSTLTLCCLSFVTCTSAGGTLGRFMSRSPGNHLHFQVWTFGLRCCTHRVNFRAEQRALSTLSAVFKTGSTHYGSCGRVDRTA